MGRPTVTLNVVIPANAGIQGGDRRATFKARAWMPACAGMTEVFW